MKRKVRKFQAEGRTGVNMLWWDTVQCVQGTERQLKWAGAEWCKMNQYLTLSHPICVFKCVFYDY